MILQAAAITMFIVLVMLILVGMIYVINKIW